MNLFADSSALAKRYLFDEKSNDFDGLLQQADSLAVSVLCLPEIISALCRRLRERFLTKSQYAAAKAALESDLADAAVVTAGGCIRISGQTSMCRGKGCRSQSGTALDIGPSGARLR